MSTIFITGGATGIGRATVERFIAGGWNVLFMDVNRAAAAELVEATDSDKLRFVEGDTRRSEDCSRAVAVAGEAFGGLDSVFANAGIHRNNTLLNVSDEELHRIVDINIFGTVNTLQAAVPAIIETGGGTVVINCSDQWYIGKPNSFAYGLTKGALGQITRSLSIDLAPYKIRVNAICPGSIHTPLLEGALERSAGLTGRAYDELMSEENASYTRGRMGQPEEVARLVWFLAGDDSSFCTGGHYLIDGGLVAR